jgi:hypothetical protein
VFTDVDQDVVPLAVWNGPASTATWTLATETSSEADPATVIPPDTVAPEEGEETLTVGGVVSALALLTVTESMTVGEMLPELSVARASTVWVPLARPAVLHDQLQLPVPDAVCHVPLSTVTWTVATETLSEADPDTVTVPETVAPALGELTTTDGGVVSVVFLPDVFVVPAAWAAGMLKTPAMSSVANAPATIWICRRT